ncbi:hypothetical protein QBC35DRAFT_499451 [Podospora australis]|uniref:Uncharacterized protein n=1 Tax=Podospora australis TaxID=1536484 RepID=A0AAN6WVD7_9PEZI|nr:hypothetical protein QBC35DRAFT_499451 [Podospora australis]
MVSISWNSLRPIDNRSHHDNFKMASKLQIHSPYVLHSLPSPFNGPDGPGRYIAGEVFGQKQGLKRKKRSELAVAIDGVAIYIYDILTSQQVTSYDVSTQAVFTCAPYSLRWRPSSAKNASRYTYVSTIPTKDSLSAKKEIKLFKEELSESGNSSLTTKVHLHDCDSPIVHLVASSSRDAQNTLPTDESSNHDLVAIAADGTILCLDGETLEEKWKTAPTVLSQELASGSKTALQVDYVQPTLAADVVDGLFGGKNELFGVFQEKVHRDGFNPDILVVVTSTNLTQGAPQKHMHLLALPSEREAHQANRQTLIPIFVAPLPNTAVSTKYQLDVRSGTLQSLAEGLLSTYVFNNGIARLENKLLVPGMSSFLRLSKTSVLAATPESFSVYNPIYRSLQATTSIKSEENYQFITYLATREVAVGLHGSSLFAVQIEAPKNRNTKRRAEGLLTDAIRRGIPRDQPCVKRIRGEHTQSAILADPLPSASDASSSDWQAAVDKADELLAAGNLRLWEESMAGVFKVEVKSNEALEGGEDATNGTVAVVQLPVWVWPSSRAEYPHVDRRWVFYAINRIFSWNKPVEVDDSNEPADDSNEPVDASKEPVDYSETPRLACRFPESSVLNYLVDAGHLSTSNIKSAFKDETRELDDVEDIIGQELPPVLAHIDPTTELLLSYLSGTQLGSTELVSSIKLLLRSLDLLGDPSKTKELAQQATGEETEAIAMELDQAEEELQITEFHLGGHRFQGLGVAFSKLVVCPATATVQSLRRLFKPEETISLLNVLRAELIKDGWTSDYMEEIEAPPDGSLQLIADLMTRCIDAIGLGGWMAFDSVLSNSNSQEDAADYFSRFNLEISSALQGIHEAVRLQGILSEATGYAKRARKALADATKGKPVSVPVTEELPFGLKTDSKISMDRVRSGGEIVERSRRQIGHFASQKRAIYSVHRIPEEALLGGSDVTVIQEAR